MFQLVTLIPMADPEIQLPDASQLEAVVHRSRCERLKGCDWLISTVGTSPATSCQAIAALKPKAVTLLHSPETKPHAIAVRDAFLQSTAAIDLLLIEETNADSIAALATRARTGETVVDITGGTKVMSAAAFHLADFMNARLVYSQGEYDRISRKPKPDSERVLELPLAESIRDERRFRDAQRWLSRGQFDVALELLGAIRPRSHRAHSVDLLRALSGLWSDLSTLSRENVQARLNDRELDAVFTQTDARDDDGLLRDLREHLLAVRSFARSEERGLCIAFALLADLYGAVGRMEFASLLWYRLIELTLEILLHRSMPALAQDNVDWAGLEAMQPGLIAGFHDQGRIAWGATYRDTLPLKLGLTDRVRLLRALGVLDHIAMDVEKIAGLAAARNESILAHGRRNIEEREMTAIRRAAISLLDAVESPPVAVGARGKGVGERLRRIGIVTLVQRIGQSA
jgi:hypothetical protein